MQSPGFIKVTRLLVTEHAPDAAKVTVSPDVLVAETVNGPGIVLLVMAIKVIV